MRTEKESTASSAEGGSSERAPSSAAPMEATEAEQFKPMAQEVEDLKTALANERRRADDYLNKLRYLQADFENYRKRAQREAGEAAQFEREQLMLSLLSILDELELAIQAGERTDNKDALLVGVRVTLRKFTDLLKKEGVTTIEAAGKPFDPRLHEAISTVPRKDCKTPSIMEEIRKGFMMEGKVIRPSIVTVATPVSPMQIREERATALKTMEGDKPLTTKEREKPAVAKKVNEDE
jgi:molecular chaperone GrpE